MKQFVPIENQWSFVNIPRNRDLKLDIKNKCNAPSRQLVIDWKGDCFVCGCEAWLPVSVGRITDFTELKQVWQNPIAQSLQADNDQGLFSNCAVDRCGVTNQNWLYDHYTVSINIDESCNLRCPSCRLQPIMVTSGPDYERKLAQVLHTVKLLEGFDQPCHIVMSGNGDPLASAIMRPLIKNFHPQHNQTIRLFTNGLLLKKQLDQAPITNNITQFFISIDAGSESVYEQVRLGGQWAVLLENLDWLQTQVQQTKAEVLLKFVLQQANWADMENFCQLCVRYGFSGVIQRLENWATWPNFAQQDVIGNHDHSEHQLARDQLNSVYARYHTRIQFNSSLAQLAKETALAN